MIIKDKKLRKISDRVFQEPEPPEAGSRPLEWIRSFNAVNFSLKNIKILTGCSIHDVDFMSQEEEIAAPLKLIKADVSERIAISGILDEEQTRDSLYFAVEEKGEEGIFSIERASGITNVSLNVGKPSEESKRIHAGVYRGSAFRMNSDAGQDDIYFQLTIPKEQLLSLIAALRSNPNSAVEVGVYLLSFTDEVDDAFRQAYHARDLILKESNPCFLSWAAVITKVGQHVYMTDTEHEQ